MLEKVKEVLSSEEYIRELKDVSSYAASVKQERHMINILAKILDKKGYKVALEYKKHDLLINDTIIEVKFYYEKDIKKLEKEFNEHNKNIDAMKQKAIKKNYSTWDISYPILIDIFQKNPDIFILIVLSRNLREITKEILEIIVFSSLLYAIPGFLYYKPVKISRHETKYLNVSILFRFQQI